MAEMLRSNSSSEIAEWAAEYLLRNEDEERQMKEAEAERGVDTEMVSGLPPPDVLPTIDDDAMIREAVARGHIDPPEGWSG